jgi:hypothetical protein
VKTLLKVVGVILIGLVLLLAVVRITGLEPTTRRPGLWLKGELITAPVTDWSFTDQIQNIQIQTNSSYMLPHSVTIDCASYKGKLYLFSSYAAGLTYPHGRRWNEDVARDPHVRIKIGDKLYDRTLVLATDPAEQAAVHEATFKKYPDLKLPPGGMIVLFRVLDN